MDDRDSQLSALSGFLVGPKSSRISTNLRLPTLRPFYSDGCSVSPDGIPLTSNSEIWRSCCIVHDTRYWIGGTQSDKDMADENLRACIAAKGYPDVAAVYKFFVQQFGGPDTNKTYRWGYGWNYRRPYGPLSAAEQAQIQTLYPAVVSATKTDVRELVMTMDFPLIRLCNTTDPIFFGLRDNEIHLYHYLNSTLKKDFYVEWAKLKYWNLEHEDYVIKLRGCETPLTAILQTSNPDSIVVQNPCEN